MPDKRQTEIDERGARIDCGEAQSPMFTNAGWRLKTTEIYHGDQVCAKSGREPFSRGPRFPREAHEAMLEIMLRVLSEGWPGARLRRSAPDHLAAGVFLSRRA